MNINKQVANLMLSKQLDKLGIKQDSVWMWVKYKFWKEVRVMPSDLGSHIKLDCLSGKREYAYRAYTCAEIGMMLPDIIENKKLGEGRFTMMKINNFYMCIYKALEYNTLVLRGVEAKTLANCFAKMLIHLKENNLL